MLHHCHLVGAESQNWSSEPENSHSSVTQAIADDYISGCRSCRSSSSVVQFLGCLTRHSQKMLHSCLPNLVCFLGLVSALKKWNQVTNSTHYRFRQSSPRSCACQLHLNPLCLRSSLVSAYWVFELLLSPLGRPQHSSWTFKPVSCWPLSASICLPISFWSSPCAGFWFIVQRFSIWAPGFDQNA